MNVSDYRIVYENEKAYTPFAREAAYMLRKKIFDLYGLALDVTDHAENRKSIRFVRGDESMPTSCILQKEGDDFLLIASSASGYDKVISIFLTYLSEGKTAEFPIEGDAADRSLEKEYGNLRVLFHNIFGYDRDPTICAEKRYLFETLLYREYKAPLLCLQEYDVDARKIMAPMLEKAGYLEVEVDYRALGKNCSPIFYDPNRMTLLDQGYHPFFYVSPVYSAVCNNANTKNFTWGVFEDKQTGKQLVLISLHFYYSADAAIQSGRVERAESNLARIKNAEELIDVIKKEIRVKYPDLPILFGGDLNACRIHGTLESVIESVTGGKTVLDYLPAQGAMPASETATVFADSHTTIHPYPTYDQELGYYDSYADLTDTSFDRAIDHIYTYGDGIEVRTFDILDNTYALKSSDHCPIVVDIRL